MKRERSWVLLGCSLAACATLFADDAGVWQMDIVDELAALATQTNPTNTWSATQGGTWKLLEGTADVPYCTGGYTPGSSKYLTGFKSGSGYFTFLANTNTAYVAGPWNGGVNAGEVYFHPGNNGNDVKLQYTPVVGGAYAVDCALRAVGGNGNGNGVSATLKLDGVALGCASSRTERLSFTVPDIQVWDGQRLELVFSVLGNINGDATALKYTISRTGERNPLFSVTDEDILTRAYQREDFNPYSGTGGTWAFIYKPSASWSNLTTKYSDKTHVYGFANAASGQVYPRIAVNDGTTAIQPTDATYSIDPGELFVHPGNKVPVAIRYTAQRDGVYSIRAQARNLMDQGDTQLEVVRNAESIYSAQVKGCINGLVRAYTNDTLVLIAGDTLDIVIDPNGNHSWDGTGVKFSLAMLEDHTGEGWATYSALGALRTALKMNPPQAAQVTAPDGGVWTFGQYGNGSGYNPATFAAYSASTNATVPAFIGASPTVLKGVQYPYLFANTNAASLSSKVFDHSGLASGEIAFHPKDNTFGVCRFHVPVDGVYRVSGYFTAINKTAQDYNSGVDGGVVVNGTAFPRYAVVCANTLYTYPETVNVDVENLWLKQGDVIDFANGPNGGLSCDATVFSYSVAKYGLLPTVPHLGIDVCGSDRAAYAGAGRIGLSTDGTWASVPAGRLRSEYATVGGTTRQVRLTLGRAASATTLASVPTLISDGVVSANADDAIAFGVTGLEPGATYTLYLFSRNGSGKNGSFTIGGETKRATDCWFAKDVGDHCVFTVTADANGAIEGTFAGAADGAATFCGLQILGELPEYVPTGTTVIFR